jgi:4'-phosphopantetheinyl transferase
MATAVRVVHIPLRGPASTADLLAAALGRAPGELEISRRCRHCGHPSHGRPVLAGGPSFSVSHSGGLALVALAPADVLVGVDVEQVRRRANLDKLAARVLSPEELAQWRATPPAERLVAFLRQWTAKEAYLKALGLGIATRLADVDVRPDGWTTMSLSVGEDARAHVAALAVDRRDVMLSDGTAG